ncbi:Glycosyltransferase involved in cell wall bisynthesis [Desulfocicer vacuolatum DSM 3385]|uniref:Glycosyltransferase involved in cell wall bisynthesis n=1 Tax=Desulfocicer vacuolatum DSM 3385 TaxID=1121400 RepID=A0A1W2BJ31_9BACT|nr:glycosyltransferase family 2 protein [Desulfocicer vacuolatum]SMC72955.1 Glycosyltransferase involved in cell wall bisynthesis [Desulfocicer vacuolatum DSM 3385]
MKVSIIIPAFNEAESIGDVVKDIKATYPDFEIIVVNDASSDNTAGVAKKAGATVLSHPYNIGNGASIKTGMRMATGDFFVTMDGDGQHRPEDIGKLLAEMDTYDMVVGQRTFSGQASFGRYLGNLFYNRFASYVANFKVRDLTSGFRAVNAAMAKRFLYLFPNTYSYPTTLTLSVLRSGRSVKYIPISSNQRRKGKSGIHLFKDGVRFFMIIIKICTLFSPLRIFLPVSGSLFLLGIFHYMITYLTSGRFTNMSALLLVTSVVVFMMGLVSEQICQMRFERTGDFRVEDRIKNKQFHEKGRTSTH